MQPGEAEKPRRGMPILGKEKGHPEGAREMAVLRHEDWLAQAVAERCNERRVARRGALERDPLPDGRAARNLGQVVVPHAVQRGGEDFIR